MDVPAADGLAERVRVASSTATPARSGSARPGVHVPTARRYLPGTMVLETTWGTRGGWIIVRDLLLIGPWHHCDDRSNTHRRAPTDYDADHVLLRTVRCVNGEVQLSLVCEPAFDYGRERGRWEYAGGDYHDVDDRGHGDLELHLVSDLNLGIEGPRSTARHLMKEGEQVFCALSWTEHPAPRTFEDAYGKLVWTAHHWQHWLDRGNFPDHPWRSDLQRSALTLKGLTYAPTGAVIAAATTSLPETPGGERNWDYRYTWIRDATFALWGLYTLGFDWEANDFFYFVADCAEAAKGQLQIMYGIDGRAELPEQTLDHLSGYENARPVRIGNGAHDQDQHDVWGAVLDSVYLHTKSRDALPERVWPLLKQQVEAAIANWRDPDRGIWEVRGDPKHFTSSKLMCWVALDRGARLAELREDWDLAMQWRVGGRRDPRRHLRARARRARRVHPALRHDRARRLDPADAARALPARRRRAHPRDRAGDRRRAHARRARAALQGRGDRRRTRRRGGHVHDLLVLARHRAVRDRRARARRAACASGCSHTRARSASTPRRSTRAPAATSATSRRPSRTWR